ncbi:MAG: cell division protein ZapA [Rhodospirillales bacterium]|nr:cell division protein ZapA [Rhodospirillales bacterium]
MAQVSLTINERRYQIACEDGQEAHLSRLAAYVDRRIGELVASVGQVGDAQLLVMVSLLIADELSDAYGESETLRAADQGAAARFEAEETLGSGMDALANRIEDVAAKLKEA